MAVVVVGMVCYEKHMVGFKSVMKHYISAHDAGYVSIL